MTSAVDFDQRVGVELTADKLAGLAVVLDIIAIGTQFFHEEVLDFLYLVNAVEVAVDLAIQNLHVVHDDLNLLENGRIAVLHHIELDGAGFVLENQLVMN